MLTPGDGEVWLPSYSRVNRAVENINRYTQVKKKMNSKELNVNVPLAAGEDDFDDFEFSDLQSAASPRPSGAVSVEGGLDCISGSLEDLVATFDEKLTVCFCDFKDSFYNIKFLLTKFHENALFN